MIKSEYGMWLEPSEVAHTLGVDVGWVVEVAQGGWLPAVHVGGQWLVPETAVAEAAESLAASGSL